MSSLRTRLIKNRAIEAIKYDFNSLKYPFVLAARMLAWSMAMTGNHPKAFKISSDIFRTGWEGSYSFGLSMANAYFKSPDKASILTTDMINSVQPLDRTKKFFDNPKEMFNGIVTVLKSPGNNEKGALILNYSYYFPLFLKFFDVRKIMERYNIILEPSWAGFCETSILAYSQLGQSVYVMTYEERDKNFIKELDVNLIPVDIGPSWFVNHNKFVPPPAGSDRDIDIIMVAAWAKFKRHAQFFKALSKLKEQGHSVKVALVGYPTDMEQNEIREIARLYGIEELLTIYEWITPDEVAALLKRSKINILWSRFEGNNRAIIEGMFCDAPVILREGHNYGEHYDFINEDTGHFASEHNLVGTINKMLNGTHHYNPRKYVMENRNCISATNIMNDIIRKNELATGRLWTKDLTVKVNELHGMTYLDPSDHAKYKADYATLADKYIL